MEQNDSGLLARYCARLLALERRRPRTAETYRFEIRRFLEWTRRERLALETLDAAALGRYLAFRRGADGIDSRSAAKALSALRSFFRFLEDERIRTDNCASLLEAPRRGIRYPRALQPGEVERLFAGIDTASPLGLRNRTLYEVIYSCGLRISEAVGINLGDLFLKERTLKVTGKGGKERLVLFGPEAASWLGRYLSEARPSLLKALRSKALFVTRGGRRIGRKGVWKNYRGLALRAGLSTKVHTLRHTFATDLLRGGADLRSVQELLGHANLATTQIYTHVDQDLLRESHRQFLPRLSEWREGVDRE
ncbi:MAG: tyrosine-type recombinase/integrase [Treponema sp.]|jgi:integrase/recombinase XerD|nr:tyrosine-type recombinase/integrase [Treponema sp.]